LSKNNFWTILYRSATYWLKWIALSIIIQYCYRYIVGAALYSNAAHKIVSYIQFIRTANGNIRNGYFYFIIGRHWLCHLSRRVCDVLMLKLVKWCVYLKYTNLESWVWVEKCAHWIARNVRESIKVGNNYVFLRSHDAYWWVRLLVRIIAAHGSSIISYINKIRYSCQWYIKSAQWIAARVDGLLLS
jgi:hypothetical protein